MATNQYEEPEYSDDEEFTDVVTPKTTTKVAKKRKRVGRACVHCQRSHMSCDDQRPCKRCIARGCADQCRDGKRKRRGRKRKSNALDDDDEEEEIGNFDTVYTPKPKRVKPQADDDDYVEEHELKVHTDCQPEAQAQVCVPMTNPALRHPQPKSAVYSTLVQPQPTHVRHPMVQQRVDPSDDEDDALNNCVSPMRDYHALDRASSDITSPSPPPVVRPETPCTPVLYGFDFAHLNLYAPSSMPASESDVCVSGGWTFKLDKDEVDLDQYFHSDFVAQRAQLLSINYSEDSCCDSIYFNGDQHAPLLV